MCTMFLSGCQDIATDRGLDDELNNGEAIEASSELVGVTNTTTVQPDLSGHPSKAYYAKSYDEIRGSGSAPGAGLDDAIALQFANSVCNLDQQRLSASLETLDQPPDNARARASLNQVSAYQKRFCQTYTGQTPLNYSEYIESISRKGDEGRLLSEALSFSEPADTVAAQNMRQELTEQLDNTASPYFFLTAHEMLLEEPFVSHSEIRARPAGMDTESLLLARRYGVMLATCAKFEICLDNSIFSVRTCMPYECVPGGGVEGYVRERLNTSEYEEAQRYARALVSRP